MARERFILAMLATWLVVSPALAQPSAGPQNPGLPRLSGFWQQGRFIGYVPPHLNVQAGASRTPRTFVAERLPGGVREYAFPEISAAHQAPLADSGQSAPQKTLPEPEELPEEFLHAAPTWASRVPIAAGAGINAAAPCASCGAPADCCRCAPLGFWARAEYLLFWTRGMHAPALATTSPVPTPEPQAGVLGQSGTSILFGNGLLNTGTRSGGRFTLGTWLDPAQSLGIETDYLFLGGNTQAFHASGSDYPILARPFFDSNPLVNAQDSQKIAYPGLFSGRLDIGSSTQFQTAEVLLRRVEWRSPTARIDRLLGYRFAQLEDAIRIDSTSQAFQGPVAGATVSQFDAFKTRNSFNGGVVGMSMRWQPNARWSTDLLGSVGLGATQARTVIAGQTTSTIPGGASTTSSGGLLAQPTNIGTYTRTDFSALAELGATMRYTSRFGLSTTIGYTFLYWADVARAGDQIDLNVNSSQIFPGMLTGPARPAFPSAQTGFWAQGLRFGLDYAY